MKKKKSLIFVAVLFLAIGYFLGSGGDRTRSQSPAAQVATRSLASVPGPVLTARPTAAPAKAASAPTARPTQAPTQAPTKKPSFSIGANVVSGKGTGDQSKAAVQAKATPKPTAKPRPTQAPQTYVLNTNTGKFHKPSCASVDQIKDKNKLVTTAPRSDILSWGYSPCKRCNP